MNREFLGNVPAMTRHSQPNELFKKGLDVHCKMDTRMTSEIKPCKGLILKYVNN